jgi:hypothetical protein
MQDARWLIEGWLNESSDAACARRSIDIDRASSRTGDADAGVRGHSDRQHIDARQTNLTDRAVSGFESLVTIDSIEDAHIQFSGSNESGLRISGSIDRVTDETEIHLNGGEQGIGRKKPPIIAEMQADAARCLLRNAQQLFAT